MSSLGDERGRREGQRVAGIVVIAKGEELRWGDEGERGLREGGKWREWIDGQQMDEGGFGEAEVRIAGRRRWRCR